MKELQIFLQDLTDPLVLWQRVTLLALLLIVLVGLFSLWRIRKHKRLLEDSYSHRETIATKNAPPFDAKDKQPPPYAENTTTSEQQQQPSLTPVQTKTFDVSREGSSDEAKSTDTSDPATNLNRIIACWKKGQSNDTSKVERIGALQEGLALLQQLPLGAVSPETKSDWSFMFEGELRRLKNADQQ